MNGDTTFINAQIVGLDTRKGAKIPVPLLSFVCYLGCWSIEGNPLVPGFWKLDEGLEQFENGDNLPSQPITDLSKIMNCVFVY
jgi:hypothetical protein